MNLIQLIMSVLLSMLTTTNNNMYTILKNTTPIVNVDNMETAIRFIQSLEQSLDRSIDHSPYTIERVKPARNTLDIYQVDHDQHMRPIVA